MRRKKPRRRQLIAVRLHNYAACQPDAVERLIHRISTACIRDGRDPGVIYLWRDLPRNSRTR